MDNHKILEARRVLAMLDLVEDKKHYLNFIGVSEEEVAEMRKIKTRNTKKPNFFLTSGEVCED